MKVDDKERKPPARSELTLTLGQFFLLWFEYSIVAGNQLTAPDSPGSQGNITLNILLNDDFCTL